MRKSNAIIIATILATFIVSMYAFSPTKTEASNSVLPSATPSPRKIRKISGDGTTNHFRTKTKRTNRPKGFTEVTGLDIQVERRKNPRRKSAQYNPKKVGINKIKAKKPTNFTSAEGRSMSFELRRKKPRKRKH